MPQAPQFPPQEQLLFPFFRLRICTATTHMRSAATTPPTTIVGHIRITSLSALGFDFSLGVGIGTKQHIQEEQQNDNLIVKLTQKLKKTEKGGKNQNEQQREK